MKAGLLMLAALLGPLLGLPVPAHAQAQDSNLQRFAGASGWLNSPPLGPAELRGKVVLVQFWTYTCINWLRTEPYVRAWSEKYKEQGLVVIGAHTPEFEFEKNVDNIRRAVRDMNIAYPVAIDSDYRIWNAFSNNAWPAIYLIDAQGKVRYRHAGEEQYGETERMIQQLLVEAGKPGGRDLAMPEGRGAEAAPDWANLRSPETYLGPERAENRVNTAPARLRLNQWTVSGSWTPIRQGLVSSKANGRIAYRFHARDLHLVMGPATPGKAVRFRVLVDGNAPGPAHGTDVNAEGYGAVTEQRLYQLVRQPQPITDRLFEIEFLDPAVEAFVFTFG